MTQIELEVRLAELEASYIEKKTKNDNTLELCRKHLRETENNFQSAIKIIRDRMSDVTIVMNEDKKDYIQAKFYLMKEWEMSQRPLEEKKEE